MTAPTAGTRPQFWFAPPPVLTAVEAKARLDAHSAGLARRAFTGVTVTASDSMRSLRRAGSPLIGTQLLGPAALLACPGGPYADPVCVDLFDGWKAAQDMVVLPPALSIAATLGGRFTGTVAELTAVVTAALSDYR